MSKVRISRMLTAVLALVMMVSLVGVASAATDATNATFVLGEGEQATVGTVGVAASQSGVIMNISSNSANSWLECQLTGPSGSYIPDSQRLKGGNAVWTGLDSGSYTGYIVNEGNTTVVNATIYAM